MLQADGTAPGRSSVKSRSIRRRRRVGEFVAESLVQLVALTSIASVVAIMVFVGKEALPVFTSAVIRQEVTLARLFLPHPTAGYMWQPVSEEPKYNILPLFLGTLKVTLIALAVAVPISVAAAVYVAEYASKAMREVVKPLIELLSGIPSVVTGFFALVVLSKIVKSVFHTDTMLNALVAGIALSVAACPLVFSVSEDALRAVPGSYRAAASALGATRTQALLRVVLPAASPGIAAATVLGFGRAIGETMIVLLASGNAALVDFGWGKSTRTVTATIAQELGEVVVGSPHYHVLFVLGALLFLSTLGVNLIGERIVHGMRRRLGGV